MLERRHAGEFLAVGTLGDQQLVRVVIPNGLLEDAAGLAPLHEVACPELEVHLCLGHFTATVDDDSHEGVPGLLVDQRVALADSGEHCTAADRVVGAGVVLVPGRSRGDEGVLQRLVLLKHDLRALVAGVQAVGQGDRDVVIESDQVLFLALGDVVDVVGPVPEDEPARAQNSDDDEKHHVLPGELENFLQGHASAPSLVITGSRGEIAFTHPLNDRADSDAPPGRKGQEYYAEYHERFLASTRLDLIDQTFVTNTSFVFFVFAYHAGPLEGVPERTTNLMTDITARLTPLASSSRDRDPIFAEPKAQVVEYGDYHVILAERACDILPALDGVPQERRPLWTPQLQALSAFCEVHGNGYGFILGCFDGSVKPTHPIVVGFVPPVFDWLRAPGWDGHDGELPVLGQPMQRDFHVAFGVEGLDLPIKVNYSDDVDSSWAPASVAGFWDNRSDGPNRDYGVGMRTLERGVTGRELAKQLL